MALIGSLGNVVFGVSPKQIKTFNQLQWNSSARYATHNRHLKKALIEKTGIEADRLTFSITLSAYLGTNPEIDMRRLRDMLNNGDVLRLTIGDRVTEMSRKHWVVQQLQRTLNRFDNVGNTLACRVNITVLEYARR